MAAKKTIHFPSTGRKVTFSKSQADDYHAPERAARRAKRRATKKAGS
jgi:hypothetical protein